jgi:hypothetical protein
MSAEQRGSRAAWRLFGVLAGLNVLVMLVSMIWNDNHAPLSAWFGSLFITPVVGLIAAGLVHFNLPPESRRAFWVTGLIGMAAMVGVFGVTCGMSLVGVNL